MNNNIQLNKNTIIEKLVSVNRHSKTVKGGRVTNFTALVLIGNKKGLIGLGKGKAREVPSAIQKAIEHARRKMIQISLNKKTVWYDMIGRQDASKVFIKPASPGTGIIAGGSARAVFEVAGIKDVLTKIFGSTNPVNVTKATIKALLQCKSPNDLAKKRGKLTKEII